MIEIDWLKGVKPGQEMHDFICALFPLPRSLTGEGTRETLRTIQGHLPQMVLHEVPSGTKAFDWTVPNEWTIRSARLIGPDGETVVDFADNNLHVVGYSVPVDVEITLDELQLHLYSREDLPSAIPYVTSYYKPWWGFCLPHRQRESLKPGIYRAVIDSDLAPGFLSYGELVIPGQSDEEVFFSTYVCHPSMANNELSGPAVATWIAKWVAMASRRYTYRFVFLPETIGSVLYLSKHLHHLKAKVTAGFNVSCVGDERCYSYLPSRSGDSLSDRVACHVLDHHAPDYIRYTFLDRGSDERQYCSPGADLPIASILRSKYGEFPEYHTSLDDLELVTPMGLQGTWEAFVKAITLIEANGVWRTQMIGEPQLGKRGLYPAVSEVNSSQKVRTMMNLIAFSDGTRDLIDLAETIGVNALDCLPIIADLEAHEILKRVTPNDM